MRLINFSSGFLPITIMATTSSLFSNKAPMDSKFDAFSDTLSILTNRKTADYINSVDKSDVAIYPQLFKIADYIRKWKKETSCTSSPEMIVKNRYFQAIINLGVLAVPSIVSDISKEPSNLVWALNIIYNKKISTKKDLTISEACKLWVRELSK